MIPVKLTMRNFMCYRDNVPPLYFDGIHLACLSGDNGNGKSALIDAITWALWGRARAKSDDDLIHSGQTEMEVEFEFRVAQQLYRIIRKRSKPKRQRSAGQSILELQMSTEDGYKSITGNSIAQTQQKIIDILHMDYDTFINSAYLRQGHADEFTVKRPVERKEVLGEILGLSLYDELERQAKELAKQQGDEKTIIEGSIKDIIGELAQKPAYTAEFEQVQGELASIETVMEGKEARLKELRQTKEAMEKKKAQLEQIEAHIGNAVTDLERWAEQVTQHHSRLKEYQELINQRSTIEEGYVQFTEARRLSEELDQIFRQSVNLERRKAQLDSKIKEAGQSLKTAHIVTQSKIGELEDELQKLPELNNQLHQAQAQLQKLAEPEEILRQKKQALQELQTQVNYLESNKTRLEREIREIKEKLSLLSAQKETRCPLCETELSLEGLKLITSKYTADGDSKSDSLKSNQAELTIKISELESLKNEISHLESRLTQEKTTVQSKIIILEKEIVKTKGVDQQLAEERMKLDEIEQHLASKDFATTEQEALQALEDELARLDYDAKHHERVQQQLKESEHYVNSKHKLDEADKLINQERENVSRAEKASRELRNSLGTDNQKKQALTIELAALPTLINNLAEAEDEHQKLTAQRTGVQQIMWSVKTKLQRCTELEIKKKGKESQLAQTTGQENIYKELAKAFGKGGIQALLIEIALPEIETEANKLLGRMTDNRMHLKFETQRETKKGNVIETLDINISDELGTRNYEMFSGGEAFRINFAIRIALSKLLAKRAGAPLPTLIIDEGFGTQDSTGIEKLKEAINSIQDDFDKIFVITHIEELRDAFPTRIDVIKTAEGSTLSIS